VPDADWAEPKSNDDFLNDPRSINHFRDFHGPKNNLDLQHVKKEMILQFEETEKSQDKKIWLVAFHMEPMIGLHNTYRVWNKTELVS